MSLFRTRAERHRADRLVVLRFFGLMAIVVLAFALFVALNRLLRWW